MDCVFLGVTLALLSPRVSPVWFLLDLPCSLQRLVVSEPAVSLLEGLLSAPHRNRNLEVCDALCHLGHAEGVGFVRVCQGFLPTMQVGEDVLGDSDSWSCLFLGSPTLYIDFL